MLDEGAFHLLDDRQIPEQYLHIWALKTLEFHRWYSSFKGPILWIINLEKQKQKNNNVFYQ